MTREYQTIAEASILEALETNQRIMFSLMTGGGKTVIITNLIKLFLHQGKRVIFIAHRQELIRQAWETFHRHQIISGIIMAGNPTNYSLPCQVASIQTIIRRAMPPADYIFVDECFVPGTTVDNLYIESIKIGDIVNCWDEQRRGITKSKVTRLFKTEYNRNLYKIRSGDRSIVCTDGHPILTQEGWKCAKNITLNDKILIYELQQLRQSYNWDKKNMLKQMHQRDRFADDDKNEPCSLFGKNDKKQSHAQRRVATEDEAINEGEKIQDSWWKWQYTSRASITFIRSLIKMATKNGVHFKNRLVEAFVQITESLQNRYSHSINKTGDRDRWNESQQSKSTGCGQEEGCSPQFNKLDSIEIYEFGSDEWIREMQGENFVYNIEVEKYHTYIANGIVVHNCHHVLDDNSYGKLIKEHYPNAKVIGVTATPYRLGGKGFTKIFDCLIESLQLAEGIDQGFLVPLRYFACTSPDLKKIHLRGGDYIEDEAVKAMELVPIVESYFEHAKGKCGICFAINVSHSRKIVDQYLAAGIRAEHVDANTPNDQRAATFKRLRDRVTQIIVNVGIATEGVDIPNIEFVQCARPTKSLSLFMQMIGRGTRVSNDLIKNSVSDEERKILIAASDKPNLIVLDNAGLYRDHGLPDQRIDWQRYFRGFKKEKKPIEEMIEILIAEDESGRQVRTKVPKEIEGLKLIEITHQERERVANMQSLREFDRLYALFKKLPKISKPGFKAYFEYRDYCLKNSILMNDDVWEYLKLKLSSKAREQELAQRFMDKKTLIERRYSDSDFLLNRVNEHHQREMDELKRYSVPDGFLHKEREKYQKEALKLIPA